MITTLRMLTCYALPLLLHCSGSGKGTVTAAYCDTLISSWLSRAAVGRGSPSHLQLLNAAFQRTPNPDGIAEAGARQLVLLSGLRLAARAVKILENDEDDLFFETGRTTQEMLEALVSINLLCPDPVISASDGVCTLHCWLPTYTSSAGFRCIDSVVDSDASAWF